MPTLGVSVVETADFTITADVEVKIALQAIVGQWPDATGDSFPHLQIPLRSNLCLLWVEKLAVCESVPVVRIVIQNCS